MGGTSLSFSLGASTGVYLPFSFPFYDTNYSSVFISPEGYLQLGSDYFSNQGDVNQQFVASIRIAPFWDASLTYRIGDGLFIDTSTAGQVSFRWKSTNPTDDSPVNLAVVLFSDGRIRFDYGSGNAGLNPLVGISYGRTRAFQYLSGYNGIANLSNANSVLFTQAAGYTDMGAYEFRGSGLDTTPPTIASTLPTAVGTSADTGGKINAIQLLFSEDVNAIDASATAVYELRKAGLNGFGSADDLVYSLSPQYTPGSSRAMLKINGLNNAGLPVGQYRLTVTSNTNTSVHDLAGLRLDGDADGSEGGNYVRTFSVTPPVADLSVALIVDNPNPFEGMNLQYTVTISDLSGPASVSGVLVNDLLPAGLSFVSATATAGSYDNASGIWTIGGMTLGGSQTLRITAKVPLGLAFRTLTNTATLGFVDQGDTNAVNDSASVNIVVRQSADLALTMDASNSPRQGDLQYYYLTINNSAGPGTATGVQVTDMLPNGLRFVSATPGSGTSYNSATGIWTVGTLTKGASVNLQIVGQVVGAAGQNVTNTASITAAEQFDYKVNNNTASRTLTIFGGTLIPWQNPLNPLDVDDSGDTNPLDVLVLINDLNISGSRQLSAGQNPADPRKYLDVDGDGFASPLDVLVIINFINRRGNGEGESPQLRSLARTKADETVDVLMTDLSWLDVLEKKQTSKCSFSVEGAMTSWSFAKPGG